MATTTAIRQARQLVAEQDHLDAARETARQQVETAAEKTWTPDSAAAYRRALRAHSTAIDAADDNRGKLIRHLAKHNLSKSNL